MKRFHVHVKVKDLQESIAFYNALFNTSATVVKSDYAKWMLEDPRINFAISSGHRDNGIEHLGLQVDSPEELQEVYANIQNAKGHIREEGQCTCCYSKSEKSWITDPQGVDWETFYTFGSATVYGEGVNAKLSPEAMQRWAGKEEALVNLDSIKTDEKPVAEKTASCDGTCSTTKPASNLSVAIIALLVLVTSMFSNYHLFAQTSQERSILFKAISAEHNHYSSLSKFDASTKNTGLDSIAFNIQDFNKADYLKMKTVYMKLPVKAFKIKDFPGNSSDQTRAELDYLLMLQSSRTAADVSLTDSMANIYYDPFTVNELDADYKRNINSLFFVGRNLGPWFNAEQLPVTSKVLQNMIKDATYYFFTLKANYNRARPYQLEPALVKLESPGHGAYPSGHSSASYIHAYFLSELFPQYTEQFMSNAYDMAFSREIRGVHYPSDSEAGREFAQQFVEKLMKNKKFQKT